MSIQIEICCPVIICDLSRGLKGSLSFRGNNAIYIRFWGKNGFTRKMDLDWPSMLKTGNLQYPFILVTSVLFLNSIPRDPEMWGLFRLSISAYKLCVRVDGDIVFFCWFLANCFAAVGNKSVYDGFFFSANTYQTLVVRIVVALNQSMMGKWQNTPWMHFGPNVYYLFLYFPADSVSTFIYKLQSWHAFLCFSKLRISVSYG